VKEERRGKEKKEKKEERGEEKEDEVEIRIVGFRSNRQVPVTLYATRQRDSLH
jgi:hypothetical protein